MDRQINKQTNGGKHSTPKSFMLRPPKILNCFAGHFLKKKKNRYSRVGCYFIFYSAGNRCGNSFFSFEIRTIFFKSCALTVISLDIIQVRP